MGDTSEKKKTIKTRKVDLANVVCCQSLSSERIVLALTFRVLIFFSALSLRRSLPPRRRRRKSRSSASWPRRRERSERACAFRRPREAATTTSVSATSSGRSGTRTASGRGTSTERRPIAAPSWSATESATSANRLPSAFRLVLLRVPPATPSLTRGCSTSRRACRQDSMTMKVQTSLHRNRP